VLTAFGAGVVELIWAGVAFNRWRTTGTADAGR